MRLCRVKNEDVLGIKDRFQCDHGKHDDDFVGLFLDALPFHLQTCNFRCSCSRRSTCKPVIVLPADQWFEEHRRYYEPHVEQLLNLEKGVNQQAAINLFKACKKTNAERTKVSNVKSTFGLVDLLSQSKEKHTSSGGSTGTKEWMKSVTPSKKKGCRSECHLPNACTKCKCSCLLEFMIDWRS